MAPRLSVLLLLAALLGCDRNVEPYVPGEEPQRPDLSRIFPAGDADAARVAGIPPAPGAGPRGADPTAGAQPIRGTIQLADALQGRVPADGVLFLIARPGEAGPPLAVKRIPSPRFPLEFEIGPADRMIRTLPFAGPLRLTARLDADGNASSRAPGDLQGAAAGTHPPGASGVEIVLDERL